MKNTQTKKFPINTVLHTKDGRKIGNAIIIDKEGIYNVIKTDYGNECKFRDKEIEEYFWVAYSGLDTFQKEYATEMTEEHKNFVFICDNPHCVEGVVNTDMYRNPIYCQVCDGFDKNNY